ncbi:MAG TPA: hydantoinase/oxoprolinase family protein [Acidobacteriota bacterium]|nr:hydantoinase/oxoprolinase family protein [Acidobacteriota bacterium]
MLRIGIDTGGTFTDFVVLHEDRLKTFKLPSTPSQPDQAVLQGIKRILQEHGGDPAFQVRHGSTVATNALLERKGARTALVTNQGFEDVLEIGRQNRPGLYSFQASKPEPLVPRDLRVGIKQRSLSDGSQQVPLENKNLDWLNHKMGQLKPEAVAVSLLYSYLDPEIEERIGEELTKMGLAVSLSHKIHPEFREYERTSAVVINAYLTPIMNRYLSALGKDPVMDKGKLSVMQSNGGAISGEVARSEPIRTLLSGPAGGVVGAFRVARQAGFDRILTFDMGGTSTDVCLVDGKIATTNEGEIDHQPIAVQMIGIHTIGAGGGSIASVDEGGLLRVGPESAGADPGPVAYGNKGSDVTVTDAHVHLGHLPPDFFLGGEMHLRPDLVRPALERLADQVKKASQRDLSPEEVAEGVLAIADTQMENALRVISLQKGYDTRDFTLVSFGGSGGLHACRLARSLGIPRILVPSDPGLLSASGILHAEVVKDTARTLLMRSNDDNLQQRLEQTFEELDAQVAAHLSNEGLGKDERELERSLDLRYPGQAYEINVAYGDDYLERFHKMHEQLYGYGNPGLDVEIVTLRVRGTGLADSPPAPTHEKASEKPDLESLMQKNKVRVEGRDHSTQVYLRHRLKAGNRIEGPAIIVEYSSTTLIPEDFKVEVDERLNLLIEPR